MPNSAEISLVASERVGSPASRIRARNAKSVNDVRRMGSPRKFRLQILYSGLNRHLKYLFRRCIRKMIVTAAERRERITAEISERTGITEAMIERLVRAFYD